MWAPCGSDGTDVPNKLNILHLNEPELGGDVSVMFKIHRKGRILRGGEEGYKPLAIPGQKTRDFRADFGKNDKKWFSASPRTLCTLMTKKDKCSPDRAY